MKLYGNEISEEKIRWLYWYAKVLNAFMVAERRNADRQTRR